jgi:CO/xanthine dehydrogenase Mo-binding subunit
VQGLSQVLLERIEYDPESGQLLTGSFMDYRMPRTDDVLDRSRQQSSADEIESFGCERGRGGRHRRRLYRRS